MSKAVNVPTNEKIKEKDINTKLQLYGIFEGASTTSWPLRNSHTCRNVPWPFVTFIT